MAAFAASTSRIRLGQMCTCMAYRNPAYLAKVAATVDVVSGGRVEMGIGAGWYEHEWRAYGYGFPPARERLRALDEGVQIMRQAWRDGEATLDGRIYQVDRAIVRPLPLQEGGIPFWIAGGGEQVTLRIAAQYAQYTNFDGTPEGFARKSEVLAGHCARLGRDFDSITRSSNYNVIIGRDEREVTDKLDRLQDRYVRLVGEAKAAGQLGAYRGMPGVGTPEQIVEKLSGLKGLGMTYAITYFPDLAYDTSSLELFEAQVIPALAGDR
jgi:alkanesulfonate monooxygenase SsuD/methylene tetrahydromethanopterin reductase-like flavin-dependent oxidoreductase (luciferase family)